ncbi:unnamed protein product [Symbiodinium natans]|uniref:Uncharacterized protein n=1 Tax=Symbiodinium natans TaxID=878477 RepID=A0A812PQW4_9DINO|nr:unnamed protein product [Symbiodinium natans]
MKRPAPTGHGAKRLRVEEPSSSQSTAAPSTQGTLSQFSQGWDGEDAQFSQGWDGEDAQFPQGWDGEDAQFPQGWDGEDAQFPQGWDGEDAQFSQGRDGEDAQFAQGGDGEDAVQGQVQHLTKIETNGADIVEWLKTGVFERLAERLDGKIGIKDAEWANMGPKEAVRVFLIRYNFDSKECLYHFELERSGRGWSATLVTTGFRGRSFTGWAAGYGGTCKREAENDACRAFKADKEVNEARRRLPPTMSTIRQYFTISRAQRDQLRALGMEPGTVQKDVSTCIYNGFRRLGCRTAFWED